MVTDSGKRNMRVLEGEETQKPVIPCELFCDSRTTAS